MCTRQLNTVNEWHNIRCALLGIESRVYARQTKCTRQCCQVFLNSKLIPHSSIFGYDLGKTASIGLSDAEYTHFVVSLCWLSLLSDLRQSEHENTLRGHTITQLAECIGHPRVCGHTRDISLELETRRRVKTIKFRFTVTVKLNLMVLTRGIWVLAISKCNINIKSYEC